LSQDLVSLRFDGEWTPYTRQTVNSRWGPGFEDSQAGHYEQWKARVRAQFYQKGYDKIPSVPFFEPLAVRIRAYCFKMFTEKDLSNAVKGIEDALNPDDRPAKGKRSSVFQRFAWDDDKQIRMYLDHTGLYPCRRGCDRIEIDIQPLFGREPGMISYLRGIVVDISEEEGYATIMTNAQYGFNVVLPKRILSTLSLELPEEQRPGITLYIYPHSYGEGSVTFVFYGFPTKEELRVFRDICTVERVGPSTAFKFMELPLHELLAAVAAEDKNMLCRPRGIGPVVAEKVIKKLGGKNYVPVVEGGKVDDKKLEQLVTAIHGLWGTPVVQIRKWVVDQKFDWTRTFQDLFREASKLIMNERREASKPA